MRKFKFTLVEHLIFSSRLYTNKNAIYYKKCDVKIANKIIPLLIMLILHNIIIIIPCVVEVRAWACMYVQVFWKVKL